MGGAMEADEKRRSPDSAKHIEPVGQKILDALSKSHRFFAEILELLRNEEFGSVARTIGWLQQNGKITQDGEGRYQLGEDGLSQTR